LGEHRLYLFSVLIILLLGPWWPSKDKINKWKFDLPTDDPAVAIPLLAAALSVYSFFRSWQIFVTPQRNFYRLERLVLALFGPEGVALAWAAFGLGSAYGA
jgi:hypothetical protein